MSKSIKQETFSTIISADPYKSDWFTSSFNTITRSTSPSFSKDQYAVSFLTTKEFISTLVSVSKNIPDDDIFDALETKVYEELALDMAIEYHIKYIEAFHRNNETDRFFNVFVVDPLTLEQSFNPVVQSIKYIDQIIPAPLLFKSLYVKEIIDSTDVHCFLYFQNNDAFFCIYNEQEFVYAKSLKYSINFMHERFCELVGEQIEYNSFEQMLSDDGLTVTNPEYQKNLIKLFGEIFLHVSDIMTYAKRAYDIKKFDELFIGTSIGSLIGLDEYAQTYVGIKTNPLNFDCGFTTHGYVNQIHQLMHLFGRLEANERYDCNFTIFHRPPPFAKRDSGRLILVGAAALAAALLYPGVYWGLGFVEDFHYAVLSKEYDQVHIEKTTREATINLKMANKNAAQALLDEQKTAYKQKQDTLVQVHEKKVDYPMKAKIMADFTRSFNQYRVQLKSVNYTESNNSEKTFYFGLTSATTQNTTALLKHLTQTKQNQYEFYLDLISYNEEEKSYRSELKAVIK